MLAERNGYSVIDCVGCGFRHILPIPDDQALAELYREDYWWPTRLANKRLPEELEWSRSVFRGRYESFARWLPPERRRVLDIGSGPGVFIECGGALGWRCVGLEPSDGAVELSRSLGLEVVQSELSKAPLDALGHFDVVQLSLVLEHVPDPRRVIGQAAALLAPGGLLSVVVPNDFNPFQRAFTEAGGGEPWWVSAPHHINYFNAESLARLLTGEGFEVLHTEGSFPLDLFLLAGDDYVADPPLGKACHQRRRRFEKSMHEGGQGALLRQLYQSFAQLGLGREVFMIARHGQGAA